MNQIGEVFDVVEDIYTNRLPCEVETTVAPLRFHGGEEALYHGVVLYVPQPIYAVGHAQIAQHVLKCLAGILVVLIRMVEHRLG